MVYLKPKDLTYQVIKKKYNEFGYAFFNSAPYDLNIFGIRSANIDQSKDKYDDFYGIAYLDQNKEEQLFICAQTTDPGLVELQDPSFENAKKFGTAIMAEGQWRACWALGIMGSGNWKHPALIQVGEIGIYRDTNRDAIMNMDKKSIQKSKYWGICNHASSLLAKVSTGKIGRYSAGCQVIDYGDDYAIAKGLWNKQIEAGIGNSFSYTLFNENKF